MIKVCFFSSVFTNDECFDLDSSHNRDNFLYFLYNLKMTFRDAGYNLSTHDINTCHESEIIVQLGLDVTTYPSNDQKKYLILLESPHVDMDMFNIALHSDFEKIFTWNDDLVDNKKYFKINYSFQFPKIIPKRWDKKLCCMIAGNKTSKYSMELYSERVNTLKWYQENHPDEFDLYGTQWNEFYFGRSIIGRIINKLPIFRKSKFSFYKGKIISKIDTLKEYKFSICYENIKDQSGYITEKIFDCFSAGCVPLYWGAKNITNHIPRDCFIDRREFNSYEVMYKFIKEMDKKTYTRYLNSIENFINSDKSKQFKVETFANVIIDEVVKDSVL